MDEDFITLGDTADELQSPDCASIMSNFRTLNQVSQNRTSPKRTSPLRNVNRNKTTNYSDTKKNLGFSKLTPVESRKFNTLDDDDAYQIDNTLNEKIIIKLRNLKYLTDNEITAVTKYSKNELFPRMKFLDRTDADLNYGGAIITEIFDILKINVDAEKINRTIANKITLDIFSILSMHITARRCYIRETMEKLIPSKLTKILF